MRILRSLSELLLPVLFLFSIGCSRNKVYDTAHDYYLQDKLVLAIEYYDRFLADTESGAYSTIAELERSECYYQIGLRIYAKGRWSLANKFFYLANSKKADDIMDNCHYELANIAWKNQNIDQVLYHYDYIVSNFEDSELIPEVLYNRIKIYVDQDNQQATFEDYDILWEKYPDNEYMKKAQPFIDMFMPGYIEEVLQLKNSKKYTTCLEILKRLYKYPSSYQELLATEIGDIYFVMADIAFDEEDFEVAGDYLKLSIDFDSRNEEIAGQKKEAVCRKYINAGDSLLTIRNIEQAKKKYKKTFLIIPDYDPAVSGINKANQMQKDFKKAVELFEQGLQAEDEEEYTQALKYYQQSASLRNSKEVENKIFYMNNMMKAKKDPLAFANSIILNYKNGKVAQKVREIEQKMTDKHGDNASSSGWKTMYSFGEYKYEIRYDILTPEENFYFIWRINLYDQVVEPLNAISEKILSLKLEEK